MDYRKMLVAAAISSSFSAIVQPVSAETIAVDNGIAVKPSDLATPSRGMSMEQVSSKFGTPTAKIPAVGNPPISRWEYPGFVVYFEHQHVIHSVVANS